MCELILSLDIYEEKKIKEIINVTEKYVNWFKLGIIPFLKFGPSIIEYLKKKGKKIFLDLKFFDIPNTIANASRIVFEYNIDMFNIHLLAGERMLEAVLNEKEKNKSRSIVLGVTILTSFSDEDITMLGIKRSLKEETMFLASMAYEKKMNGIVCSVSDLDFLRTIFPKPFIMVCPGIRTTEYADDHKRVGGVKQAVSFGADFIVVGRPVIESSEPVKAVKNIIQLLEQ
ncbi:MAG: orotidine-5'-phosphate decarboxylase [Candidatus Omnitrophica bacterium]|nr:orotidine-5'-phosphate decarboxylase [Candidatus Omnitrophota bacterium]